MRNLKKVLALVIAFSMMLSVVAFAGYADVDADADFASAVELTSALGIFQGDEAGNFNADKTITRAEMAAVIIRMQGLDAAAKASAGATEFADVAADHWASGYINLASQNGIIKGTGDGNFAPNDTLTYEAAVAMIVRALGFEPIAERKGGWTAGYVAVANSYKVTEGAAATATRGNLAVLVANAMDTPMMDQTSYGSDEKFEVLDGKNERDYRTLLTDMDITVVNGVVGAKDADKVAFDVQEAPKNGEFKVGSKDFTIGDSNVMAYQNQQVDAYVLKDGRDYIVLAVVPSNVGETFELLSDDVVSYAYEDGIVEYYVDAANSNKTKELKLNLNSKDEVDVTVEFNKMKKSVDDLKDILTGIDNKLVFIENTGDSAYDVVIATNYTSDVVDYVEADRDRLTLKTIGTISFDFEDEDMTYILVDDQGNDITLEDLAEGDVVAIVADQAKATSSKVTYLEITKLANAAVEGTVDETYTSNGDDYIVINGEEYPLAIAEEIAAGDEGKFYIGLTGKVIYFDGSLAGENYAYILEGAIAKGAFTSDQWQLKLLTEEGIETFDIRKTSHDTIAKYITDNFSSEMNDAKDKFIFDDGRANPENAARLVTYKVDGNGELKEIAKATGVATFDKASDEYREDAQSINGINLEDDVVVFNVAGKYAKDAYVTDLSYLIDEATYTGFAAQNKEDEYAVMVITDLKSVFTEDTGFAVVTKISTGKDDEGEEVTKVSYVQNEEEGVITLNDDSELKNALVKDKDGKDVALELAIGDAFMFAADGKGVVSEYIIIAKLAGNAKAMDFALTVDVDTEKEVQDLLGEDTKLAVGYILNNKREASSKGEKIKLGNNPDDVYVVRGTAYKYTYNEAGRNVAIEVGDFMADADYATEEDGKTFASPVLLRLVNNVVIDVYGATARIEQK